MKNIIQCNKCNRMVTEDFIMTTHYKYKGVRYESHCGHCRDCDNGKHQATRHKSKLGRVEEFPYAEWVAKLVACGYSCAMCGWRGMMSIDHIVPISKGGGLNIENLQPLCSSCNAAKGPRTPTPPRKKKESK